jgi:hypothetical protein
VIVLRVVCEPVPRVPRAERREFERLNDGFHRLVLHYGCMQTPNIPSDLRPCESFGLTLTLDEIHDLVGHIDLLAGSKRHGMALWRDKLFAVLARNTQDPVRPTTSHWTSRSLWASAWAGDGAGGVVQPGRLRASIKGTTMSMGSGKTMVEFLSAAITVSVSR